jgi:bacterial/archaeal transporter family-2 protein
VNWIIYLLAAAAGAANPAQAGANAELKKQIDQALVATLFVYLSGFFGVLLIQLLARQPWPAFQRMSNVPWWGWTGGLLSIGATLAGAAFAQKLGSGVFTGISVTSSLAMSVVLDHFGLIGFKVHPASLPRILGCGLMIAGLWLMAKF